MAGAGGCGAVCYEVDPESVQTEERLVYTGAGKGSYQQVSSLELVGRGKGDFEKEKFVSTAGYRLNMLAVGGCAFLSIAAVVLVVGFTNQWWQRPALADDVDDCGPLADRSAPLHKEMCCRQGYKRFCDAPASPAVHTADQYFYHVKNLKVDRAVPVPEPSPPARVITHKVLVHSHPYDCGAGATNWQSWSTEQQRYCCYKRSVGCKTKVVYRPHYHTITKTKHVTIPTPVPVPAPPAQVITHVQNVPIHDAPQVIKVPSPGPPHVVPKYIHQKHYMPVPEPSPPQYHSVPVPVKVTDPGQVIKVPSPMPPQTIVKNKVIYKTKHLQVQHIYDCHAGFSNWKSGWSSEKKQWCCSKEGRGCPGSYSGQLTKKVVTGVSTHEGPTYYHHAHSYGFGSHDGYDGSYAGSYVGGSEDGSFDGSEDGSYDGSYGDEVMGSEGGWDDRDLKDEDQAASRRLQDAGAVPMVHAAVGDDAHSYAGASGNLAVGGGDVLQGSYDLGGAVNIGGDGAELAQGAHGVVVGGGYDAASVATDNAHSMTHYVPTPAADVHVTHHYVPAPAADVHVTHHYVTAPSPVVHVTHHYVPAPAVSAVHVTHYVPTPAPVTHHYVQVPAPAPAPEVKTVVHKHYRTVYRKVPVNHYVKVQMPEHAPIVHTVQVQKPAKTYGCDGAGSSPDPSWSEKHTRWCCYKYDKYCPKAVVDKNIYHTVVKTQEVKVPVPEPMPTHPPIVKTIQHSYHVPSPPKYVHVPQPGPTVVKPVVVPQQVPVPVPQPPEVIKVKKPYTVHVPGKTHYVHVPVPSPPHVVTRYHTQWNTIVDRSAPLYDCTTQMTHWRTLWSHSKQRWCCTNKSVGCLGSTGTVGHTVIHVHHYHYHTHHYTSGDAGDWHSHGWHAFHA